MTTNPPSSRIPELDGLRGAAVALVVIFHYSILGPPAAEHPSNALNYLYSWFQRWVSLGWTGVDLFFVLSGFLIGGILLDSKNSPSYYRTFYARRFYRIFPLYYLWILGYLFVMWTVRRLLIAYLAEPADDLPGAGVFWLFAFVQNISYTTSWTLGWAWLKPTWSLAVEEQFYVVAPLLIRRVSKRSLAVIMCSVILAAPLVRMWVHFHWPVGPVNLDLAYVLMPCRADALAVGILVALLWRVPIFRQWLSGHTGILYVLVGFLFGGVLVLGWTSPNAFTLSMESVGYTWVALFYGLILIFVLEKRLGVAASIMRAKWLRELGRVSYCVYLIHFAVGWIFHALLHSIAANPSIGEWAATSCLAAIVVYAVARMSWTEIEYPLLQRGHAYQY